MRDFDLVNVRKSAVEEVSRFFEWLEGRPFVALQGDEIPEHKRKGLGDPNVSAWQGKIDCQGQWCDIILALKSSFPDTVPRVYLVSPPTLIPHLTQSREGHVCSVNQEEVFVNPREPAKVALDTLRAAAKVIADGLDGRNQDDFDLEFNAYWAQGAEISWLSIIAPVGNSREVFLFHFEPALAGSSHLLAETRKQGETWLFNMGRRIKKNPQKALYLNLRRPLRPPFPSTNIEVHARLKAIDNVSLKTLLVYLTGVHTRQQPVVFSFEVNGNHAFGGWVHIRPASLKGFRKNKIPGQVQLAFPRFRNSPIARARVERLDMNRLQARIGNDKGSSLMDKHVMVVGCGSIGSKVALSLTMAGVGKLTLVDKETLSVENIMRHICPLSSTGLKKVEAVSKEIHERAPGVEITEIPSDLYQILADGLEVFANVDLVVSATGDMNLSMRFNEFHICQGNHFAAIHTWIEAFGLASHSNLVIPGEGGCLNCILETDGNYRHRVVTSPASETLRREAGCGSTFSPYIDLEAELAANTGVRLAISFLSGEIVHSARWVYLGDLASAESLGMHISPEYQSSGNRLVKFSLPSSRSCELCRG